MKNYPVSGGRAKFALFTSLLFLLALISSPVFASSGSVTGCVNLDGSPVGGATVRIMLGTAPLITTTTDADGSFAFTDIPRGKYNVEATHNGSTTLVQGILVKNNQTTKMSIELVSPSSNATDLQPAIADTLMSPKDFGGSLMNAEVEVEELGSEDFGFDGGDSFGGDFDEGDDLELVLGYEMPLDREGYAHVVENRFLSAVQTPLSTFAIDVDAASYTNCRRMLMQEHRLPPASAVRTEEFINYFDYDYPQPKAEHPFSITTELSSCPWNPQNQLVHIGLQGKIMNMDVLPACNLVFLIDVSGSMEDENKLPLVKQGLSMLVNELRPQDRVAIVVYAGAAGLVLPSTPGNQKASILAKIDSLGAGGSTAGGEGIVLAYQTAREHMIPGGNNRVILCTDGDFNVGVSSDGELVNLIEKERETGISLSAMGFGTSNYQDAKMEKLADNGNGNYNYIDQVLEAKRVFVRELSGTLNTIAKDVKIQVEFNPAQVKSYRLIGYENRRMENEDFNNDKKDAGELGAGHSVTALYEIEPAQGASTPISGDLRYQQQQLSPLAQSGELLTVKFRYKAPDGDASQLIERPCMAQAVDLNRATANFRFAAAAAGFGMLLSNSEFKGNADYAMILDLARKAKGADPDGYRAEFIQMVETASLLSPQSAQR